MESKIFNINRRNFLKGATAAAVLSSFWNVWFRNNESRKTLAGRSYRYRLVWYQ